MRQQRLMTSLTGCLTRVLVGGLLGAGLIGAGLIGAGLIGAGLIVGLGGCSDGGSLTDLNPAGPPMVRQLLLTERYVSPSGASQTRPVMAFGHHPDATADEQHPVTTAVAVNQRVRIVIDELLVGNYLEEVQCNERVDEDFFSAIPLGATLADIARCTVDAALLPQRCVGPKALCLRASDGVPVGVRDQRDAAGRPLKDGVADTTQFIAGAVGLRCGELAVPIDLTLSYWQPSGNQLRLDLDDGLRGLLSLGPAVVLVPKGFLPTGQRCEVTFGAAVVDKSGLRPCAPPDGEITADCVPGDTAAASFSTEPMVLLQQSPRNDSTGVSRTGDLTVRANVAFDPTVTVVSTPPAAFTVSLSAETAQQLVIHPTVPLAAGTRYVVTVPLRDSFGSTSTSAQLTFTTGV